jgi:hypothetical protein
MSRRVVVVPPGSGAADLSRRAVLGAAACAVAGHRLARQWLGTAAAAGGDETFDPAARFAAAVESPTYDPSFAAWAAAPSVTAGDVLEIRAMAPFPVDVDVVRASWDLRARSSVVASRTAVRVGGDPGAPTSWEPAIRVPVGDSWPGGFYLAVVRGGGSRRFAPFTVRAGDVPLVVQVPLTTYHAYNAWGGASLYGYNSPGGVAATLSLDRPFDVFDGAGFAFYGDWQFARWLDRHGYEASYITSFDLHREPGVLDRARLLVSVFHDEYWSTPMRAALERFVGRGGNAAFLAANSIFWRIRLGETTMTCHKAASVDDDPHPDITAQWRSPAIGKPEHQLLGSEYIDYAPYGVGFDWAVTAERHWLYEGSGLRAGDRIAGLVGYEWDHAPDPDLDGLELVAGTPIAHRRRTSHHAATVVEHRGGGTVINVGTTYWPRFLLGDGRFPASPAVERMTHNILRRLATA